MNLTLCLGKVPSVLSLGARSINGRKEGGIFLEDGCGKIHPHIKVATAILMCG